jgi:hypothetical protein
MNCAKQVFAAQVRSVPMFVASVSSHVQSALLAYVELGTAGAIGSVTGGIAQALRQRRSRSL